MKQTKSEASSAANKPPTTQGHQLRFYMDLVGHDILNNNQAVLTYLELILQSPHIDKEVKKFAERASSHARASNLLVEDIKTIVSARRIQVKTLRTVDLISAVEKAEKEALMLFPSRKMRFENSFAVSSAPVAGEGIIETLMMNIIVDAIRQDQAEDPTISVKVQAAEPPDEDMWMVRVEVRNASLPAFVRTGGIDAVYSQDSSKAVKVVGILFATMAAQSLGATFEVHDLAQKVEKRGVAFILRFKKAGGKK